jgi:ribosomal protein S18 acetylase RimI-like enzyme
MLAWRMRRRPEVTTLSMRSPEGETLARLYGHGLALSAAMSETGEFLWTPTGVAALSGTSAPGLNATLAWAGCGPDELDRLVDYVRARGLSANHLLSAGAGESLAAHAVARRLVPSGATPILTLSVADAPSAPGARFAGEVARACTWPEVRDEAAPLVAEAFSIPHEAMRLLVSARAVAAEGLDVFLARRDGVALSTVYTTTHGSAVGIWNMATPVRYQRQGAGRAVLEGALAHHAARGARLFFLGATPAGMALYRRLGFRLATALTAWTLAPAPV